LVYGKKESQGEKKESEGLLSKIWPFRKRKSRSEDEILEEIEGAPADGRQRGASEEGKSDLVTAPMLNELESHLEHSFSKVQQEAEEAKGELPTPRAKAFVDGLMSEILTEKSRLTELAKSIGNTIRSKEQELKNRERSFHNELANRDQVLKQKDFNLARLKEQLAQANVAIERLKAASNVGPDRSKTEQKLTMANNLLKTVREENHALKTKIDEMKSQLSLAQTVSMSRGPSVSEYTAVKGKVDQLQRQADELKRANQLLQEKLDKRPDMAAAAESEARKKLDAANATLAESRKLNDKLTSQIVKLKMEEARLKQELTRAQTQAKAKNLATNKAAAAAMKPPPGSKGGKGSPPGSSSAA
jgi:hypothetical protein